MTACRCNNFITGARKVCLNGLKKCLALLAPAQSTYLEISLTRKNPSWFEPSAPVLTALCTTVPTAWLPCKDQSSYVSSAETSVRKENSILKQIIMLKALLEALKIKCQVAERTFSVKDFKLLIRKNQCTSQLMFFKMSILYNVVVGYQ